MKKNLLLLLCLSLIGLSSYLPRAVTAENGAVPCVAGRTAPPIGFWTWPANSRVNVYLREPDFSLTDVPAVKIAVENWDAAADENGSNIRFNFHGLTKETRRAQGDLTLVRGSIYDKKIRHLALLEAHSLRSDQFIDFALIIVDLRVKDARVLTNVMAHEIGHSLGLLDCYHCNSGTTAMGMMKSADESNGIDGPTACDKTAVLATYQRLKPQVLLAPVPLKPAEAVDQGEEPEADDTPIVREDGQKDLPPKRPLPSSEGQPHTDKTIN